MKPPQRDSLNNSMDPYNPSLLGARLYLWQNPWRRKLLQHFYFRVFLQTGRLFHELTDSVIVTKAVQNQDKNKLSGGAPPSWQNFSIWPSLVLHMVKYINIPSLSKLFSYKSSLQKPQSQVGVL